MSIQFENVKYVYMKGTPYEKEALKNINLKIGQGEFVGIIGHTGSGKSTLIQHLNGIIKPSSGKIIVGGIDVSSRSLKELRRHVGIVFQYPEHQLFEESVYKDIAFGPIKQGLNKEEVDSRVKRALSTVGLTKDILDKSPFELSGGQKRRVAIAGVLATSPDILVMDEPAAGLDPEGRDELLGRISKIHTETGITVILVSHSMEDIAKTVQRVVVLNNGAIYMDDSTDMIFRNVEKLESVGLSAPQVTYLMRKLKSVYPQINDNIFTVKEAKKEILKHLGSWKND